MTYSNTLIMQDAYGGGASSEAVTARLWKLRGSTYGGHQHDVQEFTHNFSVVPNDTTPAGFTFAGTTSFAPQHGVGLSIQDTNRVVPLVGIGTPGPAETGWLFRSGWFGSTLPGDPIEVIASQALITPADLPALVPAPAPPVDSTTTIQSLDTALAAGSTGVAGGIDLTMQASRTEAGAAVGYAISGRLVLRPSADISAPSDHAIELSFENESYQHTSGPPPTDEIQLQRDLWNYVTNTLVPPIGAAIDLFVARSVADSVGRTVTAAGLPLGVTLSIRSVNPRAQEIEVRAALGAFGGGVAAKLSRRRSIIRWPWSFRLPRH